MTIRTTTKTRVGLATTALAASFLAGMAVAGTTGAAPVADPVRLANAALRPATSCEELRQWYVDRALERVTAWGWNGPIGIYYADDVGGVAESSVGGTAPTTPLSRAQEAGSSQTGTNVQETGVDEPDTVKTSGDLLVTVDGPRLTTYDVSGGEPVMLGSLVLPGVQGAELLLSGDTVVAVGPERGMPSRRQLPGRVFPQLQRETRVSVVDVSDPAAPAVRDSRVFDAETVAVRQHGDVVRVVLSSGLPDLPFTTPGDGDGSRVEREALAHNRRVVRESTIGDWLPTVRDGEDDPSTATAALACSDVALPRDSAAFGTLTVVAFHADDPAGADTTAVVGDAQTAYLSGDRLYLASSPWSFGWFGPMPVEPGLVEPGWVEPGWVDAVPSTPVAEVEQGVTRLYAFALDDLDTDYLAAGEVEGQVADRWAMDAVDGTLRLAVGPTVETGNFNSVVTFAERGDDLVEIGRVDALGVGEQIKSVRWFDDLAVLVTFRQTDPLYAVDLTDPAAPALLGELKIPGFSEYLHPIGGERLLGVGQDASLQGRVRGAQLALFDVADLTAPRRVDVVGFDRATAALAGQDPRQFTWLPDRETALTVLSDWRTGVGSVVVASVDGDRLDTRTVPVEAGRDVARVRLVPLADGRVVLWTGSQVSVFPL